MIWSHSYVDIKRNLGNDFDNILKKGNEILCKVTINYNVVHGLNIVISDVNLEFAVGQIEKRRQETLDRLKKEGLIDLNKRHQVPIVIKNIALVASKNTSGYEDFVKNIEGNQHKYHYNLDIFSSAVQGEGAVPEIVSKLKLIDKKQYDCVVIIRGGGSKMDLDVFNAYEIAYQVSQMRNPVFSGIGHETDVSVLDFVANNAFKTPTEVANDIINRSYAYEQRILRSYSLIMESYEKAIERRLSVLKLHSESIVNSSNNFTRLRRGNLHTIMNRIIGHTRELIHDNHNYLSVKVEKTNQIGQSLIQSNRDSISQKIELISLYCIKNISDKKNKLENTLMLAESNSPKSILRKGFVIPRIDGTLYKGENLSKGSEITLEFIDKKIIVQYNKKI